VSRENDPVLTVHEDTTREDAPGDRRVLARKSATAQVVTWWAGQVVAWGQRRGTYLWVAVPLVIYVLLATCGATQSSIGVDSLRQDPAHPLGSQIGRPEPIRSDEWLSGSPEAIGQAVSGSGDDGSPLTLGPGVFGGSADGALSGIVLFDRTLLRLGAIVPVPIVFAAYWWLPTLLLFLGLPWLVAWMTGSRWLGLFGAILMFSNPANVWWSFSLSNVAGFAVAGAALLVVACRALSSRQLPRAVVAGLVASVLIARTAFQYQPYTIVVALGVLVVVVGALWADSTRRRATVVAIFAVGLLTVLWIAALIWQNRQEFSAMLATVYPGQRRSGGEALSAGSLLGAAALASLRGQEVVNSNQSEVSSGFNVLLLASAVVLLAASWRLSHRRLRWACAGAISVVALWTLWTVADWGQLGPRVPGLNWVPAARANQAVGTVAALAFVLALGIWRQHDGRRGRMALIAGSTVGLATLYGGSVLAQTTLPGLRSVFLLASALVAGAVTGLVVWRPSRRVGYIAMACAAAATCVTVNPVLFGLADLGQSQAAASLRQAGVAARADNTLWATDNLMVTALLRANAVPNLDARIFSAPDRQAWLALDPADRYEDVWNRGGGTYVLMEWSDSPDVQMRNTSPDMIVITASPCAIKAVMPQLSHVTSTRQLDSPCLAPAPESPFLWSGAQQYVYTVG